jgi:hypothetical protein
VRMSDPVLVFAFLSQEPPTMVAVPAERYVRLAWIKTISGPKSFAD